MGVPFPVCFLPWKNKEGWLRTLAEMIEVQISLLHISGTLNETDSWGLGHLSLLLLQIELEAGSSDSCLTSSVERPCL